MNSLVEILLTALCGLLLGAWSGRLAMVYDDALADGAPADARTLLHALRRAARWRTADAFRTDESASSAYRRSSHRYVTIGALLLGAALAWACAQHGWGLHFLFLALASFLLCCLAQIDWRTGLLPDALNYPLLGIGLAAAALRVSDIALPASAQGALLGFCFLWLLTWFFKMIRNVEGMGRGDFKLAAAIGACAGPFDLMAVLFLASLAGVFFGMLHQRTLRPTGSYPFGPFLAGAALLVLLHGG